MSTKIKILILNLKKNVCNQTHNRNKEEILIINKINFVLVES